MRMHGFFLLMVVLPAPLALFGQDFHSPVILAPYSISTGDVFLGKTSDPQTVTVLNTGPNVVHIVGIKITGKFKQTNDCPVPPAGLAHNESCAIQITFTPDAEGPASGTLTVDDDVPGGPLNAVLQGAGTRGEAMAEISPPSLTFAEQTQGTPSPPQTATLSNPGKRALFVSSIVVAGDFTVMPSSTCETLNGPLAPGGKCTVVVTFSPLGTGNRGGTVTVTDDARNSPQKLSLSGTGKQ